MYSQLLPECVSSLVWQFYQNERDILMDSLESLFLFLDYLTDTKRKRHVVGGILMSVSLFFGGMAVTMLSIKGDNEDEQNHS